MSADDVDPVTLEVLWSRLRTIPREMGTHLSRTAFSSIIKYGDDFSTGLFTADGRLVAQGVYTPGHLGAMPFTMRTILAEHVPPDEWRPGDVLLTNDPYLNSGHLPDFFLFEPVFLADELVGFVATTGHQIDLGGSAPGSFSMRVSDMYGEGLHVPPVLLYEAGEPNDTVFAIVTANSREPTKLRGDIRAMRGASRVGVERFRETVAAYGPRTVERYMEAIFDRTERRMREAIDDLPDGSYSFTDHLDGFEEPLAVCATVTVDGDEVTVDFAGSAPQQPGYAINSPWNYSYSYTMMAVKAALDPETPQTDGTIRPVHMVAPTGSIVNPEPPVPVASRQLLSNRIVSAINGALHGVTPGTVPASGAQLHRIVMKFTDVDGGQRILHDAMYGGGGARSTRDGFPAVSGATNVKNTPAEAIESEFPVRISRYELVPDTAGAGAHRGGHGTIREYEFLAPAEVQFVNERFRVAPYGLDGGHPGRPGAADIETEAGTRSLDSKETFEADAGDIVRVYTCGGGGYGSPADRDPDAVHDDVADGLLSPDAAAETYGRTAEAWTEGNRHR